MGVDDLRKRINVPMAMNEEDAYSQVAAEVAAGDRKLGLWTKSLAESMGNENVAKSLYIKFRAEQLLTEFRAKQHAETKFKIMFSVSVLLCVSFVLAAIAEIFNVKGHRTFGVDNHFLFIMLAIGSGSVASEFYKRISEKGTRSVEGREKS